MYVNILKIKVLFIFEEHFFGLGYYPLLTHLCLIKKFTHF